MQDRLLNAYLTGTIEEVIYNAKSNELKAEAAKTDEALDKLGDVDPARGELAVTLFDWTQRAADVWSGSNNAVRREILDAVCLNRCLNNVNLVLAKRKPFGDFAKRPFLKKSRGDWTPIELFERDTAAWSAKLTQLFKESVRTAS